MERVKFDPKELEPAAVVSGHAPGAPGAPMFNSPISRRENFQLLIRGEKPLWMPHAKEFLLLGPGCIPDMWARGMVTRDQPISPDEFGGKDMFGVEWEFDPATFGAMVRPGAPMVEDLEHWEDDVRFPDIESWDWAASAAETKAMRESGSIVKLSFPTGLFERLISLAGMEDALMGLIDEDVQPAVHRLLDRLCVLYEGIFAKCEEYFQPDAVWFHDDWGSQRSPLFSLSTVEEMLLPYLKRVVDSAHRHHMAFELHSCGMIEPLVPAIVEAGCDMWNGQMMNDKNKMARLYGDKLICDSAPADIPPTASPEEVRANVERYLEEFDGLRTYVGMHFTEHPLEYQTVYELSRIRFNP